MAKESDLATLKSIQVMLKSSVANKKDTQEEYNRSLLAALLIAVESLLDHMIARLEKK